MTTRELVRPTVIAFAVLVLVRFVVAGLTPMTQDEAYYLVWSSALDWGYYDHPPLIAWVNWVTNLAPGSALIGRLGAMACAALAFWFTAGLARKVGLVDRGSYLAGLVLASFSAYVILSGALTTPDAVLIATWAAALHEAAAALSGDRRRWLTAGLATGVGLIGKYMMVLIGPVFLWAILACDRKALRTPWPWIGGLVALLVMAPHLMWNADNEWVSMRMQLQHGFAGGHDPGFTIQSDLPAPEGRHGLPDEEQQSLTDTASQVLGYFGGLLGLWGLLIPIVIWRGVVAIRRTAVARAVDPALRPMLHAAAWVPIGFFGLVSLVSEVQSNWAGMALIGWGLLLAGFGRDRLRWVIVGAGANALLFAGFGVYAANPGLISPTRDRILHETYGWRALSDRVATLDGPVLTDREQPTSFIRFYHPELEVAQWPRLTQPSEFVRRAEWQFYDLASLQEAGGFWLVGTKVRPKRLAAFERVEVTELHACLGRDELVERAHLGDGAADIPCAEMTVHVWYLHRYQKPGR
jgi:4-amino-4-deoxy-L-arabinose transferase-like glycosyltransferase